MRSLRTTALVGIVATIAVAACSSSDKKHNPIPEDSGAPDAAGGTGGGTSSTGGVPGTGGGLPTGGTTSVEAGVPDASVTVPDGSVPIPDAGPLYCPNIPIGRVDGGAPDAATSVPTWRNWAVSKCGACPAATITCQDLIGAPSSFDPVTRKLRLELVPGVAEVTSAHFSFQFNADLVDGGYAFYQYVDNVDLVVAGNTLTADLTHVVPLGVKHLFNWDLSITDACGTQSEVYRNFTDDSQFGIEYLQTTFPEDGAAPFFSLQCER